MSKVKISYLQVASLLAISTVFTYTSTLPLMADHSTGHFISLIISTVILLAVYTPFILSARRESCGITAVNNSFLKYLFGGVLILRLLFTAVVTALQLEFRVTCTAMSYISPLFFTAIVFYVALYGLQKGLQASARIAPLLIVMYVLVIVVVSVSVWGKIDLLRFYSPLGVFSNNSGLLRAMSNVVKNDELFFFAALCGFVRAKEEDGNENKGQGFKSVLYYLPLVLVLGLWLNFLYNVVLGRLIDSTACQMYMISSFSLFNLFERMDGIFISVALIGGILKIILCFLCIRIIFSHLLPVERAAKITSSILLAGVAVLSYFMYGNYDWLVTKYTTISLTIVMIIVAFFLPITSFMGKNNNEN